MGHQVKAIVAPAPALRSFANSRGLERPCPLNDAWALLPLADDTVDQLFPEGTGSPVATGFTHLGPRLLALLQQSFPGGALYFETDHFGGQGSQCAAAVQDGQLVHGPCCSSRGEINSALRMLGLEASDGLDVFKHLGLGRHRSTSDWAHAAAEAGTGAPFTLHWSRVPNPPADALPGVQVHALWPSPVNPDVCFAEAGFTDFGDADLDWDQQADELVQRVIDTLASHFGPATQHHAPLMGTLPWPRRLWARPKPLPLWAQLAQPMQDDRLPPADIRFGSSGARVRGSAGHLLIWIDWPSSAPLGFQALVNLLAERRPVLQTEMKWDVLWPG